ncbi:MAG TPA: hypothetical protein VMZ71_05350, partial [Gemmataceae bacterium]|nr:hypothetical protein [Gemmataceae bacterium]
MTARLLAATFTLALLPAAGRASIAPLPFRAEVNTWRATHIVVVQDGKVVERWLGDFKAGDALPAGADRFVTMPVPTLSKELAADKVQVTGKRKVIFLAHGPLDGGDPKERHWMGACSAGHHANPDRPTSVAWVEGDRAFTVVGVDRSGGYELIEEKGGVAAIKRRVDVGLKLKAELAAIKTDPDPTKRAARLAEFEPAARRYADSWASGEVVLEVGKCGAAAVPHLVTWYTQPGNQNGGYALVVLC